MTAQTCQRTDVLVHRASNQPLFVVELLRNHADVSPVLHLFIIIIIYCEFDGKTFTENK